MSNTYSIQTIMEILHSYRLSTKHEYGSLETVTGDQALHNSLTHLHPGRPSTQKLSHPSCLSTSQNIQEDYQPFCDFYRKDVREEAWEHVTLASQVRNYARAAVSTSAISFNTNPIYYFLGFSNGGTSIYHCTGNLIPMQWKTGCHFTAGQVEIWWIFVPCGTIISWSTCFHWNKWKLW